MHLPDAEALLGQLAASLRDAIGPDTALVGIHSGGVWVAERLHAMLGITAALGTLDVSFYRDDFERRGLKGSVRPSDLPFDVAGRDIVLIDDVLYTGRTIRAALNLLFDYGRPARVRLAALVDRGGRELPVAADFTGAALTVPDGQMLVLQQGTAGRLALVLEAEEAANDAA